MKNRRSINPVLLEILLVVLFLAVAAAVSVRLFAGVETINRENDLALQAGAACTSALSRAQEDPASLAFDEQGVFEEVSQQQGFTLTLRVRRADATSRGVLYEMSAVAKGQDEEICSFATAWYVLEGGAAHEAG